MADELDKCQVCYGFRGGVPGNENVIEGIIVCDYCHATILRFFKWMRKPRKEEKKEMR
jgi:hypothetical protein